MPGERPVAFYQKSTFSPAEEFQAIGHFRKEDGGPVGVLRRGSLKICHQP
jgi:hypothetical protein